MFRTRLTDLFGMRLPLLGGGMMWLSDARYVGALARGGALGFITPRSFDGLDTFRAAVKACREASDNAPFGINITQSRRPEENRLVPHWIDIGLEEGARCFETVGPSPKDLFERIHAGGARVIHKCAFIPHALKAQDAGADAVALVGCEAGGHPGTNELPTFVLGALALERLSIPLALGGGIGSGRQVAAALALGADAVVMGTRFLVCEEIWAHENYKRHLAAQPAEASTLALRSTGHPWRVLDNATVGRTREMEAGGASRYPDFGPLSTGRLGRDGAYAAGDWNTGLLSMGPAIGFADRLEPVQAVLQRLMDDAATGAARLHALLPSSPSCTSVP
ncbi:nitronate monooxygenase [Variovorax sp. J22P271]|uniref:NAD(P)H-dependent flavin oxidoreductase n=1 Tax=Variovorax davisae TaxID=3053515 RepID=UPI002575835F|nr:nitronate monooxygenase [Variovorax sp. J22P271]MDM0033572.1 nitronate monooxygenase [Variovorax sp. J22P271]